VLVTLVSAEDAKTVLKRWKMTHIEAMWYRLYKLGVCRGTALEKLGRFNYKGKL
jgi:hypothetical protein